MDRTNWKIERLSRENVEGAAKCVSDAFLLEPMTNSLQTDYETIHPYFYEFFLELLKQQDNHASNQSYYHTLVLTEQNGEKKEVLGVVSVLDYVIDIDANLTDEANSSKWENVDQILIDLSEKYEKYLSANGVKVEEGKILKIYFVGVNPNYHKRGIGRYLMEEAMKCYKTIKQNDKNFTFERIVSDLSSGGTQKIFEEQGFKKVAEIEYRSFQNPRGEYPFISISSPSTLIFSEYIL